MTTIKTILSALTGIKPIEKNIERAPNLTIKITQKIIDNAIAKHSGACIIADAIKDTLPWAKIVEADLAALRFTDLEKGIRYFYLTPTKAQQMIINFDQGIKPQPCSLKLKGEDCVIKKVEEHSEKQKEGKRKYNKSYVKREIVNTETTPVIMTNARGIPRVPNSRRRQFGLRRLVA